MRVGSETNLQSHGNAKTVQIWLKLVVKFYWENMRGQMGDKRAKLHFFLRGSRYRSCLNLLNQDNSINTLIGGVKVFTIYKNANWLSASGIWVWRVGTGRTWDVLCIKNIPMLFFHIHVLIWQFLKVHKCTFPKTTCRNLESVGPGAQKSASLKSSPSDSDKSILMPLLSEPQVKR